MTTVGGLVVAIPALLAHAYLNRRAQAIIAAMEKAGLTFLNGLPLGMIFGLVLAFLEGRKCTEALAAGLCASFIVSSGVVKSVGRWLIVNQGYSEFEMPWITGLIGIVAVTTLSSGAQYVWVWSARARQLLSGSTPP